MDRFSWSDGLLGPEEQLVSQQEGVRIYDGEQKTAFDHGKFMVTTHRLMWRDYKNQEKVLVLPLSYVVLCEEQAGGWNSSPKIVCHLTELTGYHPPGPVTSSKYNTLRFSFKEGGHAMFLDHLNEAMQQRRWEQTVPNKPSTSKGAKKIRTGIGGIEKNIAQKHRDTDKNISVAFEDLSKLMTKAKDMVNLSKNISNKIKEKQGDITEDETIKFKSYLLSLGIPDPVTRDTHGSGHKYYCELAKQLASMLQTPLKECGGIMTLTDVYCRVNRARGMELLSPDDLVNACKQLDRLALPIRLRVFESGVMVLQLSSYSEQLLVKQTQHEIVEEGSLTAEELSQRVGISVVLAKERLLFAEREGVLCRDETVEGLRFFINCFMEHRE